MGAICFYETTGIVFMTLSYYTKTSQVPKQRSGVAFNGIGPWPFIPIPVFGFENY